MVHSPRGICLIINNHDFGDSKREGSEHDVRRMRYLFEALHFKCIVHWDLPESEMKKKVEEVAALKEHEVADCLVVILMSHGEQNMIYGVDRGKLHLENDIISLFDDENCPALRGKPKVFFIQACRAKEHSATTNTGTGADAIVTMPAALMSSFSREERRATWSDIYIAYATSDEKLAFTYLGVGSWFLLSVYNVFCKHAGTLHLAQLTELVCKDVMKRTTPDGNRQTPTNVTYKWAKELYFNPGFSTTASGSGILCCMRDCACGLFKTCQGLGDEPVDN